MARRKFDLIRAISHSKLNTDDIIKRLKSDKFTPLDKLLSQEDPKPVRRKIESGVTTLNSIFKQILSRTDLSGVGKPVENLISSERGAISTSPEKLGL